MSHIRHSNLSKHNKRYQSIVSRHLKIYQSAFKTYQNIPGCVYQDTAIINTYQTYQNMLRTKHPLCRLPRCGTCTSLTAGNLKKLLGSEEATPNKYIQKWRINFDAPCLLWNHWNCMLMCCQASLSWRKSPFSEPVPVPDMIEQLCVAFWIFFIKLALPYSTLLFPTNVLPPQKSHRPLFVASFHVRAASVLLYYLDH